MARSQLINPVSNKPNLNVSIPEKSACCILGDMNANKTSDMKNAGKVVHPIFLICANKSTCNIEEAIFVVSDKGDILSPKKADRKSTRLNSSHVSISYAVFCLKKKK